MKSINITLYGQKGLCRCDQVKDLEMRFYQIISVFSKCNRIYRQKREAEKKKKLTHTGADNVATKAEIVVMQPQAKGWP